TSTPARCGGRPGSKTPTCGARASASSGTTTSGRAWSPPPTPPSPSSRGGGGGGRCRNRQLVERGPLLRAEPDPRAGHGSRLRRHVHHLGRGGRFSGREQAEAVGSVGL